MTQEEAKLLEKAEQYCKANNTSIDYMYQYMSNHANVSHDTVLEFLKPTPDALAFIKGCNTGNSNYTLKGRPLWSFDKNKIMNMLKLMKQKDFDHLFNSIQDLQHHRDTTVGLLATDYTILRLRDFILGSVEFNTPEESNDCYNSVEDKLSELMFEIE